MLPTPTKSVFIQIQAHILTMDYSSIKIGLAGKRDETTKNIVVQKRPELEQVFANLLQRPMKVMFTFVSPPQAEPVQVTSPLPISPAIAPPPITPPTTISNPPIPNPAHVTLPPNSLTNSPSANVSPVPVKPTQPKGYVGISEEDMVIRNMAEFFNGQVVDLDDTSES